MIGLLVRETILLRQAYTCNHVWKTLNAQEEQCGNCTIIATPEGKAKLEAAAKRCR